jgi:hypothetical protein
MTTQWRVTFDRGWKCQPIYFVIVHRDEKLSRLNGRGNKCGGPNRGTARRNSDYRVSLNPKFLGIPWIDLNIALLRIKLSQHVRFSGSRVGMPLRRRSASGQKKERILFVSLLWRFARFLEEKTRSAINGKEAAILRTTASRKESDFWRRRPDLAKCLIRLTAIGFRRIRQSFCSQGCSDVIGHFVRNLFEHLKNRLRRRPPGEHSSTTPIVGNQLTNVKVG